MITSSKNTVILSQMSTALSYHTLYKPLSFLIPSRFSSVLRTVLTLLALFVLLASLLLAASPARAQGILHQPPVLLSEIDFHHLKAHDGHNSVVRCFTPVLIELERNSGMKSSVDPRLQSLLKTPPQTAQVSYMSPSGRFQLHYDVTGSHAVPLNDTNQSGVPDYIERAAIYADSSYQYLVLELGFVDFLIEGRPYDIYFRNFPFYGLTRTISFTENGTTISTTHIEVHHNFYGFPPNRDPDGQQLGSLKVTIAHEMKHAIQYATNQWRGNAGTINWVELDATMTEQLVFPTVKDYLNYLTSSNSVFRGAHNGIPGSYEQATFGLYYAERFGPGFWVDVWNEIHQVPLLNMFTAMRRVLDRMGEDFDTEFATNMKWHMASGTRSRPGFGFANRELYPNVTLSQATSTLPYMSPAPQMRAYSARFYEVTPSVRPDGEVAAAVVRQQSNQSLGLIGFGTDASIYRELLNSPGFSDAEAVRTGWTWEGIDRVGMVYTHTGNAAAGGMQFVVGAAGSDTGIIRFGDRNLDGRTNSADVDDLMMRVLQSPGPSILPNLPPVERTVADVSGNGMVTLYDAALIWEYIQTGMNAFPVDTDGNGWFPTAAMTRDARPATTVSRQSVVHAEVDQYELRARSVVSSSPDNDSLWVFIDLEQRDSYSSIFAEIRYDSSLIKLERVSLPSSVAGAQYTHFYETATGARVGGLVSDASIRTTILELVFSPLQDTTVTIGFDLISLDERFSAESIPGLTVQVRPKEGVSVPDTDDLPRQTALLRAYPNPFNPVTTVPFSTSGPAFVELQVFDTLGRRVTTLFSGDISAGIHTVQFDGSHLASGVYLIRMTTRYPDGSVSVASTQHITLMK